MKAFLFVCYHRTSSSLRWGLAGLPQDVHGFAHLGIESPLILNEVEHLRLIHLEKHSGDLGGGGRLDGLDEGIKSLSDDDPLLVRGSLGELGGEEAVPLALASCPPRGTLLAPMGSPWFLMFGFILTPLLPLPIC